MDPQELVRVLDSESFPHTLRPSLHETQFS